MSLSIQSRINDVLYVIHQNIAAPLPASRLARVASFSEQHFHRVFATHMGEPVHHYIRRIRLEQAANQLLFDQTTPVQEIALKCGYKSLSSFTRNFKQRMGMSPGEWRKHQVAKPTPDFMNEPVIAAGMAKIRHQPIPDPTLAETANIRVAYIRHKGYNRSIGDTWRKLLAWANVEAVPHIHQYALLHSNPAYIPLAECRYVACVGLDSPLTRRTLVNSLAIPGGLHARFHLTGIYGEFIPLMSRIFTEWLPRSGFKLQTTPVWVEYRKNQFIHERQEFDLFLYLPISRY